MQFISFSIENMFFSFVIYDIRICVLQRTSIKKIGNEIEFKITLLKEVLHYGQFVYF